MWHMKYMSVLASWYYVLLCCFMFRVLNFWLICIVSTKLCDSASADFALSVFWTGWAHTWARLSSPGTGNYCSNLKRWGRLWRPVSISVRLCDVSVVTLLSRCHSGTGQTRFVSSVKRSEAAVTADSNVDIRAGDHGQQRHRKELRSA